MGEDLLHQIDSRAGLAHLRGLTNLNSLYVSGTKVTKSGADSLVRSIPNVKVEGYQDLPRP